MSNTEFKKVPLATVSLAIKDGTHGTHERFENGIPFLSAKNISEGGKIEWDDGDDRISKTEYDQIHKTFQLLEKDLLLTIVGSIGRRAIYQGEPVTFQRSVAYIRPNTAKVSERFLFHWFGHYSFYQELLRRSNATAQAGLYLGELAKCSMPDCQKSEQELIANILDTIDTTIRQTEAIIGKLQQIKHGLLHDLLTRGIDANGELRTPVEVAPHLYKESPLGWIPKEWEVKPIYNFGEVVTGSTPPSYDPLAWGEHTPFVTPVDVTDDISIVLAERYVSKRGHRYVRLLPAHSTLVVCIGSTIGKVGITGVESCTNQQINAVIPRENIEPDFLYRAIHKHIYQLRTMAGLQAVPIVNKSSFSEMLVPMPEHKEQAEIAKRLHSVSQRLNDEGLKRDKLINQKFGLMDDLLTGHVRVTPLLNQSF